jgi:hypothetical protein
MLFVFELCRLPQRPSLTLHPLGGSNPRMWPLFLLRTKGKRKEMTGTQHVGTLKHKFLQYITIKNVPVFWKSALIMASRYPRERDEVDRKKRRAADTIYFLFP